MALPRLRLLKTLFLHARYTLPAFLLLLLPLPWLTGPPHCPGMVRECFLFILCLAWSVMNDWSLTCWCLPYFSTVRILVLLTLIYMPHGTQALSKTSSMCCSSLLVSATMHGEIIRMYTAHFGCRWRLWSLLPHAVRIIKTTNRGVRNV